MNMNSQLPRPYRIGAGARSDDTSTFRQLAEMHREGILDCVQLLIVPEGRALYEQHIETIRSEEIPIIIHAPHHGLGINPCAPAAFETRSTADMEDLIEEAMGMTYEAADILGAPYIVLHAGRYEPGGREAAAREFKSFLDTHHDPRLILENLPAVFAGQELLGNTAEELLALADSRIGGFCLDFAHLYCTANYRGKDYPDLLGAFETLPVRLFHLSNDRSGSIRDEHLPLDHPEGSIPMDIIMDYYKGHLGIPLIIELKDRDAALYREQLTVFERLFRGAG
jgi:endonuclease IV